MDKSRAVALKSPRLVEQKAEFPTLHLNFENCAKEIKIELEKPGLDMRSHSTFTVLGTNFGS